MSGELGRWAASYLGGVLVSQEMKSLNPLPVSISSIVITLPINPIAIAGVVPFPNPQWGRTQL